VSVDGCLGWLVARDEDGLRSVTLVVAGSQPATLTLSQLELKGPKRAAFYSRGEGSFSAASLGRGRGSFSDRSFQKDPEASRSFLDQWQLPRRSFECPRHYIISMRLRKALQGFAWLRMASHGFAWPR
jgi:hypothetical protein